MRLVGIDRWTYLSLQLDVEEKKLAYDYAVHRLETYGAMQKEILGFSDDEILDPTGVVVNRQEWLDRTQTQPSSPPDSASPDHDDHTDA